jgi:hypothetical protein
MCAVGFASGHFPHKSRRGLADFSGTRGVLGRSSPSVSYAGPCHFKACMKMISAGREGPLCSERFSRGVVSPVDAETLLTQL